MIYTSYFGNLKNIDLNKFKVVTICNKKPVFLSNMPQIEDWGRLGPSLDLLSKYKSKQVDEQGYTDIYNNYILSNWNQLNAIFKFEQLNNVVMLCYEKPENFCHRHLLRKILNDKNIPCEEL